MKRCKKVLFLVVVVVVVKSVSFKCQNSGQRMSGQRCQVRPDSLKLGSQFDFFFFRNIV